MPATGYKGSPLAKKRSAVAVAARTGDPERIRTARRDYAAEKIAAYVEKVVDSAPPLTDNQRERIAALLRAGAGVA